MSRIARRGGTLHPAAKGWIWVVVVSLAVVAAVFWSKYSWTNGGLKEKGPDGSILIGTFITLYTLFLGSFGGLTNFVRKSPHTALRVSALAFMVEMAALDLYRVLNSTEDLYKTTIRTLTFFQLHDNMHDFMLYFILNLGVCAFVVMVACLPPRLPPLRWPW
jgi:hypothetical protein